MGTLRGYVFYTAGTTPISSSLPVKANILIDQTGCARLADFGLLTIISDPKYLLSSSSHTQGGTVRWMSPERIAPDRFGCKNSRPTVSSDCYALGMVIYETISGHFPFHKDTDLAVFMKVVEGKHPPRGAKFTKSLWGMLERCWASGPSGRPSIEDVLQCLEAVSNLSEPTSPRAGEGTDEDGDDWDSATNSSGGDPVDFFATDDRVQLPPIHSLRDHHLANPHHASPSSPSATGDLPPPASNQIKRPYTPDSPPPAFNKNKRLKVSLDSSTADTHEQLPEVFSPHRHSPTDIGLSKPHPSSDGAAPVRLVYYNHHLPPPSISIYEINAQFIRIPPTLMPKLKQDLMIAQNKDVSALTEEEKVDSCILQSAYLFTILLSTGLSVSFAQSIAPSPSPDPVYPNNRRSLSILP